MNESLTKELQALKFPTNNKVGDFLLFQSVWIYQNGLIYPGIIYDFYQGNIYVYKYALNILSSTYLPPTMIEKRTFDLSEFLYFGLQHFFTNLWIPEL